MKQNSILSIILLSFFLITHKIQSQAGCVNGTPNWCSGNVIKTSSRNGNGSLGNSFNLCRTGLDYVTSTRRLGQRFSPPGLIQPASFLVSGIPAGAVIEAAFLYAGTSGNGIGITAAITNPLLAVSNFPMSIIGAGNDKCWGYVGSFSYRADVTSIISGNGNYTISGLPVGATNDTDGATLLIIYSVPSGTFNGCISIDDGSIVNTSSNGTQSDLVSFTACGSTVTSLPGARAFGMFSDLQINNSVFTFNGTIAPYSFDWWNFVEVATTVTNTQTSANFTAFYPADCVNWVAAGMYTRCSLVVTTPTLGQWGMLLFVVVMIGLSSVYLLQRQLHYAGTSSQSLGAFNFNYLAILTSIYNNRKQFVYTNIVFTLSMAILFALAIQFTGYSLTEYDIPGALLLGFVLSIFISYFRNTSK